MESLERFRRAVPWVDDRRPERSAPGVGRLIGETLRQPLCHSDLQRMIGGVPQVRHNGCSAKLPAAKLRIGHNEILGESVLAQDASDLSREARILVQEVGQTLHVSVGEEGASTCVQSQRLRTRKRRSVDDSRAGNIDARKQLIKERRVAPGGGDVERV